MFYDCKEEFSTLENLKKAVELEEEWVTSSIRGIEARFKEEMLCRIVLQRTIRVLNNIFYLAGEMCSEFELTMASSVARRNALLLELSEIVRVLERSRESLVELLAGDDFPATESKEVLSLCLRALRRKALSTSQLMPIYRHFQAA